MQQSFVDALTQMDYKAWYYLNTRWHDPIFDAIIPYFRNQWFWVPVYFFLLLHMPWTYKRKGWLWCLFFFLAFVISDRVSAGIMKPYFMRLRPCHQPELQTFVHLLVDCGGQYGFPSSHAANHFSIGIFGAVTMGRRYSWVWPAALLWATLVSYAQVYVGVHFPLDVLVGGLVGTAGGCVVGLLFNRFIGLQVSSSTLPA
jgi:membrane-associated phospholipid phosphatase